MLELLRTESRKHLQRWRFSAQSGAAFYVIAVLLAVLYRRFVVGMSPGNACKDLQPMLTSNLTTMIPENASR
jgi:hypothetical protein